MPRLSQETSKYFSTMAPSAAAATTARRTTRSTLARFAYKAGDGSDAAAKREPSTDIEDAIPDLSSPRRRTAGAATLKRKRTIATATTTKPPKKTRAPARTKTDPETGAETTTAPTDWEEMYDLVKQMRLTGPAAHAAVDTMGCERLADPAASARDRRLHTLVALMLSSQTKDTVNAAAMAKLQTSLPAHAPGAPPGLNLANLLAVDPAVLNDMIWQVGFHNNKTRYIKQAAEILRDRFGGDIPDTIEGLTSLPGVGPKMAYLCLAADNGWGRVEGIGVDVHVHRITNLWGWHATRTPEETRLALQRWLPRDRWKEINWLLVGLGQKVCLPVGRKCGECELGLRGLCRAAERKKVIEGRKTWVGKVEVVKKEEEDEEEEGGDGSGVVVKMEEEVVEEKAVEEKVVNEEVPAGDEVREEDAASSSKRRRRKSAR